MIGRMYAAHPGEGERLYLRMLLNHVTECTSFQDICTLADGTVCESFKETWIVEMLQLGLVGNRSVFGRSGCFCDAPSDALALCHDPSFSVPTDPVAVWEHHQASLSEDFLCRAKRVVLDV